MAEEATKELTMQRFDIANHFSDGFCASILPSPRDSTKNEHWLAGWDAGCEFRKERTRKLNEYMISTGRKPFGIVKACNSPDPMFDEKGKQHQSPG